MANRFLNFLKGNVNCLFVYMDIDIVPVVINRGQEHLQNLEVIMAYY